MKNSIWEKNIRVMRKRIPVFAAIIEKDLPQKRAYQVETAKNGSPTLIVEHEGKTFPIHSRYDPEKEASQQVKSMNFRNPKMILIFGLGFAYHIQACLKDLEKENLYLIVVEREFQILKLAAQHVDLTQLLESPRLRWIVGVEQEDETLSVCTDMIKAGGPRLQLFLKTLVVFEHPAIARIHGEYDKIVLKNFREAAASIVINYGTCPDDSLMGVRNIMRNLEVILKNPGARDLEGAFKNVPGVIVSTGPSLDKNIHDLKGLPDRCVMICADSALQVLLKNGIVPHAFTSLERVIQTVAVYKDIPEEIMQQVWMAATPVIVPEGYQAWKGPTFITYRDFAHFKWIGVEKGTYKIGPSCSNMAFKILEAMGCNPIILVGQDCAFDTPEKTHAAGSHENLNLYPNGSKHAEFIKLKGNYQDVVQTNMFFELFRKQFVTDVAHFHGTVINSTAGGAFIEGTTLMPLKEAAEKYCTKPVSTRDIFQKRLKYPRPEELRIVWKKFRQTMIETEKEVNAVIEFCEKHDQVISVFEKELEEGGFSEIADFLERFSDKHLNEVYELLSQARGKTILFGQYFNLYLMHIVQMIIVRFEMDFNEIPSLCEDEKRGKLQAIRLMKKWFPTIRDVCKLSLNLLVEAKAELEGKFGVV